MGGYIADPEKEPAREAGATTTRASACKNEKSEAKTRRAVAQKMNFGLLPEINCAESP
jgi:hypothetical protein